VAAKVAEMASRERIRELLAVKERSGRRGGRFPSSGDMDQLRQIWDQWAGPRELLASLLPARIVTLIEVFCRHWLIKLIDHGSPYMERAGNLRSEIKYDFDLVRTLHGKTISLGLLIANSLPSSNLESLVSAFSTLLDQDFFQWLSRVQSRIQIDIDGESAPPAIQDMNRLKTVLFKTFEIRHILVHELPEKTPVTTTDISNILDEAELFLHVAEEGFLQLIYGLYPISQGAMNVAAAEASQAAQEELTRLVQQILGSLEADDLLTVQEKWTSFCLAEAGRIASPWTGGTMYPCAFHTAQKVLTRDRIDQLKTWYEEELDKFEGE
jgi:hypothetical protein